jgi:branched-chain amino acid transport system ATP-binding protein
LALGKTIWYRFFGGTYLVARAGIARTFQNIRLFPEMTVLENLLVAQHRFMKTRILGGLLGLQAFRDEEQGFIREAIDWLDFVDLKADAHRLAKTLPYGHQRKLEIARAMATRPELLCLDEPAAGLNPKETQELGILIRRIRDQFGVAVVMIEHDMGLVMDLCDEIIVLNFGEVIASGKPAEIRKNPKVLAAYLGEEDDDGR